MVEYVLLIVFGVTLSFTFFGTMNRILGQGVAGFNQVLQDELMSGGFSQAEDVWENR